MTSWSNSIAIFKTECRQMRVTWIEENCWIDKFCIGRSAKRHFAFLSPDEAKRVTSCPSCPHFYLLFQKTGPAWFACKPQFQKTEITNIYNPKDLKNFPFSWFCKLRLTWNPSLKSSFVHYCNFLQSTLRCTLIEAAAVDEIMQQKLEIGVEFYHSIFYL